MTATKKNATHTQTIEDAMACGKEAVEAAVKAGAEFFNGHEDYASVGKDNMEAVAKSTSILTHGAQDLSKMWLDMARTSAENNAAAFQAMLGCGDIREAFEIQNTLAKSSYDKMVTEGRKVSDLSIKLSEEAYKPLASRFNQTFETFTAPKAA